MKSKKNIVVSVFVLVVVILFLSIEIRSPYIGYSSIFTTPGKTQIQMHVFMNTLLPVSEESMIKEIIMNEQKVNGIRENPTYEVKLYRTEFHYKNNLEYKTILCDENGEIL